MKTKILVWGTLALSILVGLAPAGEAPVETVLAAEGTGADGPCATIDPYTGEVTVDPDCIDD